MKKKKIKFVEGQCHSCGRLRPVTYTGSQDMLKIWKCKRCLGKGTK